MNYTVLLLLFLLRACCSAGLASEPQCVGCPIGYYMNKREYEFNVTGPNGTGVDVETSDSIGSESVGVDGLYCAMCRPGTYSSHNASVTCDVCGAGFAQPHPGRGYCEPCKQGYYNPTRGQSRCKPCTKGLYQDLTGQSRCNLCGIGLHAPVYGSTNCTACGLGWYSMRGSHTCRRCPAGSYGYELGKDPLSNEQLFGCTPCPYTTEGEGGKLQGSAVVGAKSLLEAKCSPLDTIIGQCDTVAEDMCTDGQYLASCHGTSSGSCANCTTKCPSRTISLHCGNHHPPCKTNPCSTVVSV
jgi:hypothetical protein